MMSASTFAACVRPSSALSAVSLAASSAAARAASFSASVADSSASTCLAM